MTTPAIADGIALYRIFGANDLLLYIGISNNFGRRWREHAKRQPWWVEMRRLTVDGWHPSRQEALEAESEAIWAEKPKYNKAVAEVDVEEADDLETRSREAAQKWLDEFHEHWTLDNPGGLRVTDIAAVLNSADVAEPQTGQLCRDAGAPCLRPEPGCQGGSRRDPACWLVNERIENFVSARACLP